MAMRSAMHHAGATVLNELLRFPAPAVEQRSIRCSCGHQAGYQELRSKPVLTAVGAVIGGHHPLRNLAACLKYQGRSDPAVLPAILRIRTFASHTR
jgi:hypothetical protein